MSIVPQAFDRSVEMLRSIIRYVMKDVITYYRIWPANVVSQDDDGTLSVQCDSAEIGGLSKVPIRTLPGITIKVKPGSRVQIGFEEGDPRYPYAALWGTSDLDSLNLTTDTDININAGGKVNLTPNGLQAARSGDMCSLGGPSMIPVVTTLIVTSPIPVTGVTPGTIVPGTPILCTTQFMLPAYGNICSGNPNILA